MLAYLKRTCTQRLSDPIQTGSDLVALLEQVSLLKWINHMPGLLQLFRLVAINWLAGKIDKINDYLDPDYGDWKLAARATRRFFGRIFHHGTQARRWC